MEAPGVLLEEQVGLDIVVKEAVDRDSAVVVDIQDMVEEGLDKLVGKPFNL